jgi:DNA repair protein RadC
MPAAADHPLTLSLAPASASGPVSAALAGSTASSPPPLHAAADSVLLADLIGAEAAALVASVPVAQLLDAGHEQLVRLGLPAGARRVLLAGSELARRFQPSARRAEPVSAPRHLLAHLSALRRSVVEVLTVLPLDSRCELAGDPCLVAGGAVMHLAVSLREVFGAALERRAAAIVLAHNHPSGTAAPSPEDVSFTRQMARAGALLGVPLVDHLVVARRGYFSFAEASMLDG